MIFHFCPADVWAAAQPSGEYAADTLATEGFIHCSTAAQVHQSANAYAPGRTDLVLLEIDEARLPQPVRWEPGSDGVFPHVYEPIPTHAVIAVHEFQPGPDGTFAPLATG